MVLYFSYCDYQFLYIVVEAAEYGCISNNFICQYMTLDSSTKFSNFDFHYNIQRISSQKQAVVVVTGSQCWSWVKLLLLTKIIIIIIIIIHNILIIIIIIIILYIFVVLFLFFYINNNDGGRYYLYQQCILLMKYEIIFNNNKFYYFK